MKDPIERQMAIDALHVWFNINMITEKDMSDHIHDLELIINHIIGLQKVALRKLPPAQPKQGHWIEIKYAEEVNEMLIPNYECSECHYWERYDSNFCPNCGADMRGEVND